MKKSWFFRQTILTCFFLAVAIPSGYSSPLPKLNTKNECLHEDFENRVSAANQCLVLDVFKSPNADNEPLLVVFVHGYGLTNRGNRAVQGFQNAIKDASSRNLVFVAITRPGYQNGRENSSGLNYYNSGDAYRPYIIKSIATAIMRLGEHNNANNIAVIGHSGGGTILAAGLGTVPTFNPELAVLIASNLNVPAWVSHRGFNNWPTEKSLSPHELTANVSRVVEVIAVSGSSDSNALSKFSSEYVDLMKRDGKNAHHVIIEGASHNGILRDSRLWEMISSKLKKLEK